MHNSILKKRKVNLKYVNGKKRGLNVRLKMCYLCVYKFVIKNHETRPSPSSYNDTAQMRALWGSSKHIERLISCAF